MGEGPVQPRRTAVEAMGQPKNVGERRDSPKRLARRQGAQVKPLRTQDLEFGALARRVLSNWPDEVKLERRTLGDGRYLVEGLTQIAEDVEADYIGASDEVLLRELNWAVLVRLHAEALNRPAMRPTDLPHSELQRTFEEQLARNQAGGWDLDDQALVDRYFQANPGQGPAQRFA